MACIEHKCNNCKKQYMDNRLLTECIYCKSLRVTNWFDEAVELESSCGDDYEEVGL